MPSNKFILLLLVLFLIIHIIQMFNRRQLHEYTQDVVVTARKPPSFQQTTRIEDQRKLYFRQGSLASLHDTCLSSNSGFINFATETWRSIVHV